MEKIVDFFSDASKLLVKFSEISFKILPVIIIGLLSLLLVRYILNAFKKKHVLPLHVIAMLSIVLRWIIVLLVILLFLQRLGIPLTNFWALLSTLAALVALGFVAVWSVLSNVFCAFLLFIFRPFRIGDEVELIELSNIQPGLRGRVIDISLMFTSLEESNCQVNTVCIFQVPNSMFFQKVIRVWIN